VDTYTVKYQSDGTLDRYKARLVAKVYTQTYGIEGDFFYSGKNEYKSRLFFPWSWWLFYGKCTASEVIICPKEGYETHKEQLNYQV